MTWRSICGIGFFLNYYRNLQYQRAGWSGLRLHEDDPIATFELFVAYPNQSRFSFLMIRIVLAQDTPTGTLVSPFSYQRPAFQQILLQVQMVVARWMPALGRNLHVESHWESPIGYEWL